MLAVLSYIYASKYTTYVMEKAERLCILSSSNAFDGYLMFVITNN